MTPTDDVGDIAVAIAQKLRGSLLGISSAAQLLRFRAQEDPVVERNVGRILREVERLNHATTSLLEYGRPEPVRLAPGDPDAVWDAVIERHRGLLESRALHLLRTRPPRPAAAPIDAGQLARLFLHLLSNAADAAPEASDLALESEILPDGAWRCRLRNGGPAIPADVLPRIFELFFSTKPDGAGVGLALCRRIAEAHHGSISAESSAERGTSLVVSLPGVPAVPATDPAGMDQAGQGSSVTPRAGTRTA